MINALFMANACKCCDVFLPPAAGIIRKFGRRCHCRKEVPHGAQGSKVQDRARATDHTSTTTHDPVVFSKHTQVMSMSATWCCTSSTDGSYADRDLPSTTDIHVTSKEGLCNIWGWPCVFTHDITYHMTTHMPLHIMYFSIIKISSMPSNVAQRPRLPTCPRQPLSQGPGSSSQFQWTKDSNTSRSQRCRWVAKMTSPGFDNVTLKDEMSIKSEPYHMRTNLCNLIDVYTYIYGHPPPMIHLQAFYMGITSVLCTFFLPEKWHSHVSISFTYYVSCRPRHTHMQFCFCLLFCHFLRFWSKTQKTLRTPKKPKKTKLQDPCRYKLVS